METPSATAQPTSNDLAIKGIDHAVISQYFETLNAGQFQATGDLFATDGELHPPFEEPIVGPDAIANYLQAEANGFQLQPRQGVTNQLEDNNAEIEVSGKVHTPLFSVNVSWRFVVGSAQKILFAKIKLLASPKELLDLRR